MACGHVPLAMGLLHHLTPLGAPFSTPSGLRMSSKEEPADVKAPNMRLTGVLGVFGLLTAAITLYIGYHQGKFIPVPASLDVATKLGYTAKWMLLPSATVLMAVFNMGRGRSRAKAWHLSGRDYLVELQRNICVNTVEQFCVFSFGLLALGATVQTPEQMRFIPLSACLFFVGRILFMVGYSIQLEYRSFGMSINFALDFFTLGANGYLMYKYGLLVGLEDKTDTLTDSFRRQ